MRTLILSDLHLGSKNSQTEPLMETLKRESFDRLILNGDTIHNLNLGKLKKRHWAVIEQLRFLVRAREVILVRGNHDHDPDYIANGFGPRDVLPALLGLPMIEEFKLDVGGRRYLVLHGDRFDPTMNHPLVSEMAGWAYEFSNKIHKKLAKWLKKKTRSWSGVLERIRARSVDHARTNGFEGVLTGHTHFPEDEQVDDIHYANSGCWTEPPCSYLVADAGRVHLRQIPD